VEKRRNLIVKKEKKREGLRENNHERKIRIRKKPIS